MKNKFLFALMCFCTALGFSQSTNYAITGTVTDKDAGIPLEYATVTVTDANDAQDVEGGITDMDGNFRVEVPQGSYTIKIEYISFQPIILNKTINGDLNLGTVQLEFAASDLDEVTVVAETTTVDIRLDKKIYNIGKDLTTAGGTVSDALNNVPSVSVDVEGSISLRGNENVRILINGKPSAIAGYGSTDVLRQLPADAIERVEVITSPSARYDAEGTAGILNIILRKEKTLGFNGSINGSLGNPDLASISANLNLRTEKFNIFNTTGYRYSSSPGNGYFDTRYNTTDEITPTYERIIEDRDIQRLNRGFNTNLGLEYYLDDQSSITGTVFYRNGNDVDETTNLTQSFNNSSRVLETSRIERQKEKDDRYQFSLNYINRFNDEGHQLTADLQYATSDQTQNTLINEDITFDSENTDPIIAERLLSIEKQDEYLIQADYVLPFGEGAQFEAGYRGNFENEITDYRVNQEQIANSNNFVQNDTLTNVFDYTENVNAVYTQLGSKFGDFSVLAGLRLENTQLKGKIGSALTEAELQDIYGFEINTDFDNNYLGLFPTLNVTYELNERENITLGYNRRINRPRGWFLNPFPDRSSRNNVFQGNPNLQPAFANAYDLGYLKRWDKLTLTSSVYFQRETESFEVVEEIIELQGQGSNTNGNTVIRSIPVNLSSNERIGAELGLLYNPAKWLRLNGSFNFFQFNTEGFFNDVDYSAKNTSYFARFSSKVSLPWSIDWQTNAFYRGAAQNAQSDTDGILSVDMALSKDLFDEKATISMNVSDLFNGRKRSQITTNDLFTRDSQFQWRQRQINLSFVYRFNQRKNDRQNNRKSPVNDDDNEGDYQS
ncbi:TonB-dependent receptor domain-containing protein [Leeuwenhoekiella palythoae]|uniref:Outer membrane receptor protein involved in Fe transport n=1 Tax=Leeuwenhoekiella palythoae TaxID=573501 RepID=A0A1M5XLZ9_9FLAO|nr:TonB-dependent receptor [Leeuwenhoekiella palythoae]MEC7782048.1 TonB-dependent receptor [Bacteroidota bacterium]MEE3146842.1 TonB-dependent receptor [Bacteroidota bacterium]RXG30124.1 outer membrane receptor protein involved in Fe transport [Leeuwenhoekiella palythoae]UBZ10268.1 TonB-dependent receptor [Leeuwenhoekiella palythoae]SHI00682.1 Outer membrane receptor proteins, mostly Fe transport [Leeuwenhoekiella palythoae]